MDEGWLGARTELEGMGLWLLAESGERRRVFSVSFF